ncbi:MAG TPA: hypothetical protein VJK03_03665 [Candidatus Nanoarchaeia archaeon]|nr:hypothetical protein [Candidatus Nanoarchaeia archaeon]
MDSGFLKYVVPTLIGASALFTLYADYRQYRIRKESREDAALIRSQIETLNREIGRMNQESPVNQFKISSLQVWHETHQNSCYADPNYLEMVVNKHTGMYEHVLRSRKLYKVSDSLIQEYAAKMLEFDRQVHKFDEDWPVLP